MAKQLSIEFEVAPQVLTPEDIYANADVQLLKSLSEDKRFERKRAKYAPQDLGDYFSMWANTPEGGLIALGVEDDGRWTGCVLLSDKELNARESAGKVYCPEATCRSKRVPFVDDQGKPDFLVLFLVAYHPTRVIKTTEGKAFVRVADTKHKLRTEEERDLAIDKGQIQFEQELCGLSYPQDFDTAAIQRFVASIRKGRKELASKVMEEVLVLRCLGQMVRGGFKPNFACALLFAKQPDRIIPGCRIRFLRFDGKEEGTGVKFNAIRDEIFEGNIPELLLQAENALDGQLRNFARLNTQQRFSIIPEYPKDAWYEALVNALVHRSYGNGQVNTPVAVKMFDNRILIESPGGFPPFVSPDNIYGNHRPRNPKLMDALYYLEYVKCASEGTRRMREAMRASDLPDPEFEQKQLGSARVQVLLKNNVEQRKVWIDADVTELIGAAIASSLDEHQKRIVNFVAENSEITVSDVQRMTGLSWPAARKRLARLVELHILEHVHKPGASRDPQAKFVLKGRTLG
jgi:ATP-dependent DNA helicase RecG